MKLIKVSFGVGGTIHIQDKDSKTKEVLCGYSGRVKNGVLFSAQPTSEKKPMCKKCEKLAKSK